MHENGTYSTFLYAREAVKIIDAHDASVPFFMYLPFQVTHSPYEIPQGKAAVYDVIEYGAVGVM